MTQKYKFPEGFLWGAASSAHQTEGNNTNSDWWAWENSQKRINQLKTKGLNPEAFKSGIAVDAFNRFDEDFALANMLKHNATRLSIEWARIEPKPGVFNEVALEHYEQVLRSAKFYGLKTFVTLHHFTNPIWFAQKGGFENRENLQYFIRYASKMARRLSENVDFWLTINEPEVYTLLSYWQGVFPPHKKKVWSALKVAKNLVLAHKFAVREIKFHSRSPVSMAFHLSNVVANGPISKLLVKMYNRVFGHYFIDQTINFCDFIGVNYYFQHQIGWPNLGKSSLNPDLKTDIGWEIHPEGLEPVLLGLKKYEKPIYITENGIADQQDHKREQFIKEHLFYAHKAIASGVDLRGYLHWSLTDNFEWEKGFAPKFGLVAVNREQNFKRQVRFSAIKFAEICWNNFLEY